MGIWDTILTQLGGGQGGQQGQLPDKLKQGKFYSLSKIAEKEPQKKKPLTDPSSLMDIRKKQGGGMWQADIGE